MEGKDKTSTNTDYLAAFLVMIGSVLYCVGFIYPSQVKIHPVGNAISRGLTLAIITYIYSRFKGIDLTFASLHNLKWQFNRNIIMFFQGMCFSWSLYYLPLPIAFTINNSSPLFVVILDKLFYGIELNRKQLIWLIIAFIGVILTVNGNQIMSKITGIPENTYTQFQNYFSKDPLTLTLVGITFLSATAMHAAGVMMTKKLKNTNSIQINFFQGILVFLLSSILAPIAFADSNYNKLSMQTFGWSIILTGIPSALGGLAFISALTITRDYALITPFQFSGIPFGYLLSIIRYNEAINWVCLSGSVAITVGIVAIIRGKESVKN